LQICLTSWRRGFVALAGLTVVAWASGCKDDSVLRQTRRSGDLIATLDIKPAHPAALHPLALHVTFTSLAGDVIDVSTVTIDAEMPGMKMAPDPINVVRASAGIYDGQTLLPMEGLWVATVTVLAVTGLHVYAFNLSTR